MTFLLLCSALCTVAGGALGAAWRRAARREIERSAEWAKMAFLWATVHPKLVWYRNDFGSVDDLMRGER